MIILLRTNIRSMIIFLTTKILTYENENEAKVH